MLPSLKLQTREEQDDDANLDGTSAEIDKRTQRMFMFNSADNGLPKTDVAVK